MSRRVKAYRSGGGLPAIRYVMRQARKSGGVLRMWKALRSRNACKTCALGMGGQSGGMKNEAGRWPEVCKKSVQAMAADMQGGIGADFWKTYSIAQLAKFTPRNLEHAGRLVQPVLAKPGANHFEPVTWDEAYQRIEQTTKPAIPDETFWYFSGRSSNEAGFLLQLAARLYGTNNINNCSYFCHQASGVGLNSALGTGTATVDLEDLENADLVFLIGGNPASNHPRLMSSLLHVRRSGGKVVVINPVVETGLVRFRIPSDVRSLLFGSEIASHYVQPHIGGDLALLCGIAKRVVEMKAHAPDFLRDHCDGVDEWLEHLSDLSWSDIEAKSGVDASTIDELATLYSKSKGTVFAWTMGITHHAHGVHNVQAIANLALMRGMVGRDHAGLMPIRGHSNVQGIGTMGVTPKLKETVFERLEKNLGVTLPTQPGMDTMSCMDAANAGRVRLAVCLGGNLYGSNPDSEYASQALANVDLVVYLSTTLNTGHANGIGKETIILPVLARDEEPSPTTQESMFNYVRLSDGGPRRHDGPRSEIDIVCDLAARLTSPECPVDWKAFKDVKQIRTAIANAIPGMEPLAEIDSSKKEFYIGNRILHQPTFATATGRAQIHVHALPSLAGDEEQFRLMTIRSEGQFNTVVYEEEDVYRGQERRDIVLVHPDDLERLNIEDDQPVTVSSAIGSMTPIRARAFDKIRPGNVSMYYPESNVLVPRSLDPKSKTPAFKGIPVTITPAG